MGIHQASTATFGGVLGVRVRKPRTSEVVCPSYFIEGDTPLISTNVFKDIAGVIQRAHRVYSWFPADGYIPLWAWARECGDSVTRIMGVAFIRTHSGDLTTRYVLVKEEEHHYGGEKQATRACGIRKGQKFV